LELLGLIEDYRQGRTSEGVHYRAISAESAAACGGADSAKARPRGAALNRYPVPEWVHQQVYLHPYPKELMLRNHV
jgi:hypothetical protein